MNKLNKTGALNAVSILVYIAVVALIMQNGDRIFGETDNYIAPVAFLLLFTVSAATVGALVLGKPLMLYLDGKKKEAVAFFMGTALWLVGFTILALVVAVLIK